MADVKISALPLATTPLAGTEVLPIVQSATTDQVSVANLTAGRAVSAASLTLTTTPLDVASGGTGLSSLTAKCIPFGAGTSPFGSDGNLVWDNTNKYLGVGTSTPSSIVQINSTAAVVRPFLTATTGFVDWQIANTGGNLYVGIDNSAGGISGTAYGRHIYSDGAYPLDFFTDSTLRMRIDASGNLLVGTTTTGGGKVCVKNTPSSQWGIDFNECVISIANGSNAALPTGSGMIVITDPTQSGATAMYIMGAATVALASTVNATFVAPTTTPGAGTASIQYASGAYRIYNNIGTTISFQLAMFRTRADN